jgi:hypothetical protein
MTVGPWKPILFRTFSFSLGRIKSLHPRATLDPKSQEPYLDISVEIEGGPFCQDGSDGKERKWEVGITVQSRDGKETLLDLRVPVQADKADTAQKGEVGLFSIFHGPVKRASKWWPVGYGSQSLYTITVDLYLAVCLDSLIFSPLLPVFISLTFSFISPHRAHQNASHPPQPQ